MSGSSDLLLSKAVSNSDNTLRTLPSCVLTDSDLEKRRNKYRDTLDSNRKNTAGEFLRSSSTYLKIVSSGKGRDDVTG